MGNGIEIAMDGVSYRFDPRRVVDGDVNFVSHAHSDHLPTRFGNGGIVWTELTMAFARTRRKNVEHRSCRNASLLSAGHIPGSAMVMVEGSSRVLYTGDFCTRGKSHVSPAKPHRCDALIMESTYGRPGYDFPEHGEVMSSIRDWLEDVLGSGSAAVLISYPLGKAQELCHELRGMPVLLQPSIAVNNAVAADHGLNLGGDARGDTLPEPPFVYVTSGMGRERPLVDLLEKRGARLASFSGWAAANPFATRTETRRSHATFPLSDHCGYNELLEFARACGPEVVYTTHGCEEELAEALRKELGMDAHPLVRGQKSLDCFC